MKTRALALTAAGISIAGALALPAVAAAAPPAASDTGFSQFWGAPEYPPPPPPPGYGYPGDWNHPEWGPGWNSGYPAAGWIPPQGWYPPSDWNNPGGWQPPPNWAGPCGGPVRVIVHPVRCW